MPRDVVRRATSAFYRAAVRHGETSPLPVTAARIVGHAGTSYVVLAGDSGVLAIYKVRQDGILQRVPVEEVVRLIR